MPRLQQECKKSWRHYARRQECTGIGDDKMLDILPLLLDVDMIVVAGREEEYANIKETRQNLNNASPHIIRRESVQITWGPVHLMN